MDDTTGGGKRWIWKNGNRKLDEWTMAKRKERYYKQREREEMIREGQDVK